MPASQVSAFHVMADMLDAMADALHFASSVNGNTQRSSSPAAWENTGGSRLKGEWSSNPVRDANLSAGLLASSANDHASMSQRYFLHQGWDPAGWQENALKTYRGWAALAQAVPGSDGLVTVPRAQMT